VFEWTPLFADSFDLLVLCYSQQHSTLSASVPVQFGYCIIFFVQFNSTCMQFSFWFYLVQLVLTKAEFWLKWAWFGKSGHGHPKCFGALCTRTLSKNPLSLIPGSASVFCVCTDNGVRVWWALGEGSDYKLVRGPQNWDLGHFQHEHFPWAGKHYF